MNPGIIKLAAAALLVLLTLHGVARGESNEALVQRGNAAYGQGNFDEALALYDEASVTAPESPQIHFNRGAVHYQKENYTEAIDAFKVAALRSKDLALSAQAKFNLGNCAFRNAQRQRDSDLAKAIEYCEESISYYQEAHGMDSESTRAAENIEIVRLYVKVLLDEQKKQQEQDEQEQQQQQQSDEQQQDQDQQDQEDQDQEDQGDQQEQKPEDGEEQEGEQEQEPQDGEPDPDQQEEEEPEQRAAESAEDILDEEKENQKERQPARPGRIKPVDKDW